MLENLVRTEGNIDVKVEGVGLVTYARFDTGDISSLEVGKTYTYSITFQGKSGGYGNVVVLGASAPSMKVHHTGDVQTVHRTVTRRDITSSLVNIVASGTHNYEVGESIRLISCSIHEGEQGSDVCLPPHSELTSEQISMMKYGEFAEAGQI